MEVLRPGGGFLLRAFAAASMTVALQGREASRTSRMDALSIDLQALSIGRMFLTGATCVVWLDFDSGQGVKVRASNGRARQFSRAALKRPTWKFGASNGIRSIHGDSYIHGGWCKPGMSGGRLRNGWMR